MPVEGSPIYWPDPNAGPWVAVPLLDVIDDERAIDVVGLTIRLEVSAPRQALTAAMLRRLPFSAITRYSTTVLGDPGQRAVQLTEEPAPRRGRPPLYGIEHYEAVASTYSTALEAGQPPVKAVAAAFNVAPATASQWVTRARNQHHLLPAAPRGKAAGMRGTNG